MVTARRVAGGLVFALFVGVLAVRPLVSNPALVAGLDNGLVSWQTLAAAPLVTVSLLVVLLRLTSPGTDPETPEPESGPGEREGTFWDARKEDTEQASATGDRDEGTATEGSEQGGDTGDPNPGPLSGQGGTRDREFEIEAEPPDALLEEHLEHLQAELDGDSAVAEDLHTLEAVVTGADKREVPERCPQEHCEAVWSGRTVLGVRSGRYERLDDERVQCLECETVTELR